MANKRRVGITEKRLSDKRFKRTEDAIIRVFFEGGKYNSVSKVAKKVGVARSTFYAHHKTVYMVVPDYKIYILEKYGRMIHKLARRKGMTVRRLYMQMLMFLLANREVFGLIARDGERVVLRKMVAKLSGKVEKFVRLPKNSGKMFVVYENEIVGLVEKWGKSGMDGDAVPQLLNDIMFLTNTMRVRLAPLLD